VFLERITQAWLHRYLSRFPIDVRNAKYDGLSKIRWIREALEEIKPDVLGLLPEKSPAALSAALLAPQPTVAVLEGIQAPTTYYHQYPCEQGSPLSCSLLASQNSAAVKKTGERASCDRCQFPGYLPEQAQLGGKQGLYQIGRCLGQRGIGRLYEGINQGSEAPVVIKEYLLPTRYFNPTEQRQYQEAFKNIASLALADGRVQDLRAVTPLEAIAEPTGEKCYLITPEVDRSPTLNHYCAQLGSLSNQTVADILSQVLQTLMCLHGQKFTFPAGQTRTGIIHGNIGLDSLLWVERTSHSNPQGFVYLTDFALWEKLFDPSFVDRNQLDVQQDLSDLGGVAFSLLNGAVMKPLLHGTEENLNQSPHQSPNQPLNPRLDNDWPECADDALKSFILRLMGIEAPFVSAEAARTALLKLPPMPVVNQYEMRAAEVLPVKRDWYQRGVLPLIAMMALLMLGTVGWLLWRSQRPIYAGTPLPPCCLDTVAAVPTGDYVNISPKSAYWYPLFRTSSEEFTPQPTLLDQIEKNYPDLSLKNKATPSVESAIAAIQSGQADFAIVPLPSDANALPADISATIIAYDSLVPVVAFNYPDRIKGLPDSLKGEITLDDLKRIYTGEINHWQQISSANLSIRRYVLNDPTIASIFEQRVLLGDRGIAQAGAGEGLKGDANDFNSRENRSDADSFSPNSFLSSAAPETLSTIAMMRSILQDFENRATGSIGIAPLSQVAGQCSVYPLAIAVKGQRTPVSPLVFKDGKVVKPKSDLCDRKGSYHPNAEAIRSGDYPLAYPLAVIYPFDNSRSNIGKKIADLLLTQESQAQLITEGMVSAY
jgi:ABC-type phosphate transport system substrate-binding protein